MSGIGPLDEELPLATGLLSNTSVYLFHKKTIFTEFVDELRAQGMYAVELDASTWNTESDMHDALSEALEFPAYYGRNLDALNDCLRGVVLRDHGSRPNTAGTVLAIERYDHFATSEPRAAQIVLDIWAGQSRRGLLFGHQMLCLIQSDDPELAFQPVGASPVVWNPAERLRSKRGL